MKIAILLGGSYPVGMACTNRTHIYSKGLLELGNDVEILMPYPTESPDNIRNFDSSGVYEGVKFRYGYGSVKKKSFLGRRIQKFISILNSFFFLFKLKPDIILIVTNNFTYILTGKICSLFTGAKIVREKTEVPFYKHQNISFLTRLRIKSEFKLFDGLMVISSRLKDFFQDELALKMSIIEVPILIDSSQNTLSDNSTKVIQSNLVYSGSLVDNKDGIIVIIKAFHRVLKKYPKVKLILTGDINDSADKEEILSLIDKLNLVENVELTGYISKKELKELTFSCTALLLAKPHSRQNSYNMATKIGEYLLTGRPIVVSSVDPITIYLKHREDAFIIEPEEEQFADQIEFILSHPKEADLIGSAGKKSGINLFDYKIHAQRINDFFKSL